MKRERIFALTSLAPARKRASAIQKSIQSWRSAGLEVRSFNHPSDITELEHLYDVEFVPVTETTSAVFGKHLIPIHVMCNWAAMQNVPVLLINSDIHLEMEDWEIKRIRWLSDNGLCYFVRYNHNDDITTAARERFGIDAYLFHGRNGNLLPNSFLSMGQPFWDYWLPYAFAIGKHSIYAVEFPAVFHQSHKTRWSWENWHRCALEFARMTGALDGDRSFDACVAMSLQIRQTFDSQKVSLLQQPFQIKTWIQERFNYRRPKIFLELGAHKGTDTAWMAKIPNVILHGFEPDPRDHQISRPNVTIHRAAIAERNGRGSMILSLHGWGQEWTHSSSIKRPKNHLHRYPVTFGESIEIELVTLDSFCELQGLGIIDFIWADVQGAEGEMIRGGQRTLARTRYLYTEYSDDEMYENQATLKEIVDLLPEFRVVELWPDNVLMENRNLQDKGI